MADPIVGFLRIDHGRVFVASADGDLAGTLTLGGTIPFERERGSSLDAVNLIAHADPGETSLWQLRGAPSARLGAPEDEVAAQRPGAHEILFGDVPANGARAFAIYHDRLWGEAIPVFPGTRYSFAVSYDARDCQLVARLEFLDAQKGTLPPSGPDRNMRTESDVPGAQRIVASLAAPADAAFLRCVIVVRSTADAPAPCALFWQPSLKAGTGTDVAGWSPRPINFAALYNTTRSEQVAVYSAPIDVRAVADGAGEARVYAGDTLVEAIAIPEHHPRIEVEARIVGIQGSRLVYSATRFEGTLGLYIDGVLEDEHLFASPHSTAEHGFYLPDRLLDGEPHLIQLRDEFGVHVLMLDYLLFPAALTPWDVIQRHAMPPLPGHLSPLAADRLRAFVANAERVAEIDDPTPAQAWLQRHMSAIYATLVTGFEHNRQFFPLEFEVHEAPVVSIVIPVHNKYSTTFHCLCALLFAGNKTSFEVIVTDDGSTDETAVELATHTGIKIARNAAAEGFIGACKAGAALARGDYILFLNNDTEPTAEWLDELVKCFRIFPKVGAAAAKLLYPDGRLQDAGGIIWKTGNPWNYGRRMNPAEPKFSYSRQADYVSGAALITRRDLWEKIGGFADELRPAYFEDTWYSFAVREQGYRTYYCATSRVYHFEGVSNGKDVTSQTGLKRFQEINRPKFKRRWTREFQNFGEEGKHPDLEKDRGVSGRVLFVDWQCPRPDMDAGSYAAIQEMRLAKALGLKVSFLPLNLAYMGRYTEDLNRLGVETWHAPFVHSVNAFFAMHGAQFDAVYMTRYNVAEVVLPFIKASAPQAKTLFCLADLHFLRELRMAVRKGDREAEERACEMREEELAVVRQVDVALSYSDTEISILECLVGSQGKVMQAPWVQEVIENDVPFGNRQGLAFLGSFRHPPNLEAIELFAQEVLPLLAAEDPALKLHVYGSGSIETLAHITAQNLAVEGFAPDLATMYARHRIFVAPLATGAGIKGKVIGALAHGIPTILSPAAAEGVGVTHDHNCLIARTPADWVAAIARLSRDPELWGRLATNGRGLVAERFSFVEGAAAMRRAFEAAELYLPLDVVG